MDLWDADIHTPVIVYETNGKHARWLSLSSCSCSSSRDARTLQPHTRYFSRLGFLFRLNSYDDVAGCRARAALVDMRDLLSSCTARVHPLLAAARRMNLPHQYAIESLAFPFGPCPRHCLRRTRAQLAAESLDVTRPNSPYVVCMPDPNGATVHQMFELGNKGPKGIKNPMIFALEEVDRRFTRCCTTKVMMYRRRSASRKIFPPKLGERVLLLAASTSTQTALA